MRSNPVVGISSSVDVSSATLAKGTLRAAILLALVLLQPPGWTQDYWPTNIGTLGGQCTVYNVNNNGEAAGYSDSPTGQHAFLHIGGVMLDLGTLPGYSSSFASD